MASEAVNQLFMWNSKERMTTHTHAGKSMNRHSIERYRQQAWRERMGIEPTDVFLQDILWF